MHGIVERNLRTAMRCYASVGGTSHARDYPGITVVSSGLDVAVFNSAMLTEPTDDIQKHISMADVHFGARALGWTFWLCEDLLPPPARGLAVRSLFAARGMRHLADPPGMCAESLLEPLKPQAKMTFGRVGCNVSPLEFAYLASVIFSLAPDVSKQIYGATGLWQPPSYGWIGYSEGLPVAMVALVIADGTVGVYSLGTLPQCQGRGFGETLLRYALGEARRISGIERTVLQATPQGVKLYLRLGYRVVSKFSIYLRESCGAF